MFALIVVLLLAVVAAAVISQAKKKSQGGDENPEAEKKKADYGNAKLLAKPLLTNAEQHFYKRLAAAMQPDFIVLAQVSMGQLFRTTGGSFGQNRALYRTISQKAVDYVICRSDLSVMVVVELDDPSHDNKKDEDAKRDKTLRDAGYEVLRLPTAPADDVLQRYADSLKAREAAKLA